MKVSNILKTIHKTFAAATICFCILLYLDVNLHHQPYRHQTLWTVDDHELGLTKWLMTFCTNGPASEKSAATTCTRSEEMMPLDGIGINGNGESLEGASG